MDISSLQHRPERKGYIFEICVKMVVERMIKNGDLGFQPSHCAIFHRKFYKSKADGKLIQADVSVEIRQFGEAEPFLIIIWECKNYSGSVGEAQLKKFLADIQEIGASRVKGILATPTSYSQWARSYAEKHGLGLWTVKMPPEWYSMDSLDVIQRADPNKIQQSTELNAYPAPLLMIGLLIGMVVLAIRNFFNPPPYNDRWRY